MTDDRNTSGFVALAVVIVASLTFALGPAGPTLAGSGNGNGNGNMGNGNGNGNTGNNNGNGNVGNNNGNGNAGSGNGNGYRSDGNGNGVPNAGPNSSSQAPSCCGSGETGEWNGDFINNPLPKPKGVRMHLQFADSEASRR